VYPFVFANLELPGWVEHTNLFQDVLNVPHSKYIFCYLCDGCFQHTFCSCIFYSSPLLHRRSFLFSCGCCMYNYHVWVENVLSVADSFGMLTVKIKRSSSTVMSVFLFVCVCVCVRTHEKHLSLCLHGSDQVTLDRFLWNLILGISIKKNVKKILIWLKLNKNIRHLM